MKRLMPKWLDKAKGKVSKTHEKRLAKDLGGKRVPRSGGLYWSKSDKTTGADITTDPFYIEHKRTEKSKISIKREWLEKVIEAAQRRFKDPALIVTFESKTNYDWCIVPVGVVTRYLPNSVLHLVFETDKKSFTVEPSWVKEGESKPYSFIRFSGKRPLDWAIVSYPTFQTWAKGEE